MESLVTERFCLQTGNEGLASNLGWFGKQTGQVWVGWYAVLEGPNPARFSIVPGRTLLIWPCTMAKWVAYFGRSSHLLFGCKQPRAGFQHIYPDLSRLFSDPKFAQQGRGQSVPSSAQALWLSCRSHGRMLAEVLVVMLQCCFERWFMSHSHHCRWY